MNEHDFDLETCEHNNCVCRLSFAPGATQADLQTAIDRGDVCGCDLSELEICYHAQLKAFTADVISFFFGLRKWTKVVLFCYSPVEADERDAFVAARINWRTLTSVRTLFISGDLGYEGLGRTLAILPELNNMTFSTDIDGVREAAEFMMEAKKGAVTALDIDYIPGNSVHLEKVLVHISSMENLRLSGASKKDLPAIQDPSEKEDDRPDGFTTDDLVTICDAVKRVRSLKALTIAGIDVKSSLHPIGNDFLPGNDTLEVLSVLRHNVSTPISDDNQKCLLKGMRDNTVLKFVYFGNSTPDFDDVMEYLAMRNINGTRLVNALYGSNPKAIGDFFITLKRRQQQQENRLQDVINSLNIFDASLRHLQARLQGALEHLDEVVFERNWAISEEEDQSLLEEQERVEAEIRALTMAAARPGYPITRDIRQKWVKDAEKELERLHSHLYEVIHALPTQLANMTHKGNVSTQA